MLAALPGTSKEQAMYLRLTVSMPSRLGIYVEVKSKCAPAKVQSTYVCLIVWVKWQKVEPSAGVAGNALLVYACLGTWGFLP